MAKITQEELERDEVAEGLEQALKTLIDNRFRIVGGAAAILVIVLALVGYGQYRDGIRRQTSEVLNSANTVFADLPGIQNPEERKNRLDATIKSLQDLEQRYPDSDAARTSLFLQGNCHYYNDDMTKARESYEKFLAKATTNADRGRGEIAIGYTLENRFYLESGSPNLLEEALVHYQLAEKAAPEKSSLYYYSLLNEARILELRFKDEDALKIYKKVMEERPAPRAGEKAAKDSAPPSSMEAALERMIQTQLDPLSFHATAKLRADRLEATSSIIKPKKTGP